VSSGDIYAATAKVGKMLAGGEQSTVGFGGGYLSGGGHSPLSSLLGMAVDAVLEFEIVLADGSIVTVDQKSNPDLYWAVRGGGPCK
jgi:FAD/FMN-containing dehydrogenase